jgi:hypothetical protein
MSSHSIGICLRVRILSSDYRLATCTVAFKKVHNPKFERDESQAGTSANRRLSESQSPRYAAVDSRATCTQEILPANDTQSSINSF